MPASVSGSSASVSLAVAAGRPVLCQRLGAFLRRVPALVGTAERGASSVLPPPALEPVLAWAAEAFSAPAASAAGIAPPTAVAAAAAESVPRWASALPQRAVLSRVWAATAGEVLVEAAAQVKFAS